MARVVKNAIISGLSGKFGDGIIFRRVGDKTFVTAVPKPTTKPLSEKQLARLQLFREAAFYAKTQKTNPAVWEQYTAIARQRHSNPQAVAISDFMNGLTLLMPPQV